MFRKRTHTCEWLKSVVAVMDVVIAICCDHAFLESLKLRPCLDCRQSALIPKTASTLAVKVGGC